MLKILICHIYKGMYCRKRKNSQWKYHQAVKKKKGKKEGRKREMKEGRKGAGRIHQ